MVLLELLDRQSEIGYRSTPCVDFDLLNPQLDFTHHAA